VTDLPQPRTFQEFQAWLDASQRNLQRRLAISRYVCLSVELGVYLGAIGLVWAFLLRVGVLTCG
jgi:hypothetical protein